MSRERLTSDEAAATRLAVAVRDLLGAEAAALRLSLLAGGSGLENAIDQSRVQRPGLALTGHTDYIRYGRVQILGGSEAGYLGTLPAARRAAILRKLARCRVSCFVLTKGLAAPRELLAAAEARGIPVLQTPIESTPFIKQLGSFLEERLAARLHLHSVLLDVFGLGVLVMGESGIGKSECALELVDRGHRLVADDVVEIKRLSETLVGNSPELTRNHMELRGLGVLNIRDLYGVSAMRATKRVDLVVTLERWEPGKEYDRLGLKDERFLILGVELPLVRMPVAPGRNIALLVEVAARNQLLKQGGYDAARRFAEQVEAGLAARPKGARRSGAGRPRRRSLPRRGR